MAEPRYRVAPLSSEWLTIAPAMQLIANWMVERPESGPPSITLSKSEASETPRAWVPTAVSLGTPCDRPGCRHSNNFHNGGGACESCMCPVFLTD